MNFKKFHVFLYRVDFYRLQLRFFERTFYCFKRLYFINKVFIKDVKENNISKRC